jgi:hypothetical protein
MKTTKILMSMLLLAITAIVSSPALAGDGSVRHTATRHINNSYIVVLRDDVDADSTAAQLASKHAIKVTGVIHTLLKSFAITATEGQAKAISDDPRVRYVEDDAAMVGTGDQYPVPSWALDRIDQVSLPLDSHYLYNYSGQGVTVYLLDSGLNPIGDIAGRITRQINFVTVNLVRDPNNYADCSDHGTKVADIIGGTTYGVAKNVTFVNVRVFDCSNSGTNSDFNDALDWIVSDYLSHGGPAVVNYSGRFFGISSSADDAVMRTLNIGLTFICAAGNEAVDACADSPGHLSIPGNYSPNPNQYSVITVSGTDTDDSFNPVLNYGQCVSILAPSVNVPVYDHNGNVSIFGASSGATAFVSSVAALHLERFPTATPSVIGAFIKSNGSTNQITSLPVATPNLLLYNSIYERHHACCVY